MKKYNKLSNDDNGNKNAWMNTYSDMVTLLLCFFVLLMTFSTVDEGRFMSVLFSLKQAFGVLDRGQSIDPDELIGGSLFMEDKHLDFIALQLDIYIAEHGLEGRVQTAVEERGLVIRFVDGVLFGVGQAQLKEEAKSILNNVGHILADTPNQIMIEGHTDNLPIQTERFPSNWELSTARATTVIRHFIENFGLDPSQLSAAGYGEYRPIAPNDTSDNRSLNRRVDIVVLKNES